MKYPELIQVEFFQGLSLESLAKVEELDIRVKEFEKGDSVNFFGDPIEFIYVILKGCLKTNEYLMSGKEVVSSYYFAPDAFPFYLVYGGAVTYPYNVYCHKKAKVLALPVDGFKSVIAQDIQLMQNVLVFVSKYCVKNKKVIQTVSYSKVSQRLAFWLLASADNRGCFEIPGTQKLFADMLLVNRSSLNQELKNFDSQGLITIEGREVRVLNRQALEEIIQEV